MLITRPARVQTPRERIQIDLRVGGRYALTMLLPDGSEFTIGYEIVELVEPERLVLRPVWDDVRMTVRRRHEDVSFVQPTLIS